MAQLIWGYFYSFQRYINLLLIFFGNGNGRYIALCSSNFTEREKQYKKAPENFPGGLLAYP